MVLPLHLLIAALVPLQGGGEGTRLAIPGEDALAPELREELSRFDPTTDGWESEVAAEGVAAWWEDAWQRALAGTLSNEAAQGPFLLGLPEGSLERGGQWLRWERVIEGFAPAEVPDLATGLRDLSRPVAEVAWLKVKVVGLVRTDEADLLRLRIELLGAQQAAQVVLELEALHPLDGGKPRQVRLLEYSAARRSDSSGFQERDLAELLGPRARSVLEPSTAALRRMLDTRLGVGLLGHHGISAADLEFDGRPEIFVASPGGVPNLFLVADPSGRLVDRAPELGLDLLDSTSSALFVDLDGDGLQEAVMGAGTQLLIMTGRPFALAQEVACEAITSLAAGDMDGDGDLDLFVCGYVSPYGGSGAPMPYHDARNGARNRLLRNEGGLRFVDVTAEAGLEADNSRFTFAATWLDVEPDGDQDLYVVNDFGSNQLWLNDQGRFVEMAADRGVRDVAAGMGVSVGDVDGDGLEDLFVSNMFSSAGGRITGQARFLGGEGGILRSAMVRHAQGNSLFLGREGAAFQEAVRAGGAAMGRWAWGGRLLDLDLDGALDVACPAGFVTGERLDDL